MCVYRTQQFKVQTQFPALDQQSETSYDSQTKESII